MAFIGLQKGSGKRLRVREKSVKSQGILIWIMSGNPEKKHHATCLCNKQQLSKAVKIMILGEFFWILFLFLLKT